jgi:hypothetical protein
MVKALKGDTIKGYFEYRVGGKLRRFDQKNVSEFVDRIPRALARMMLRYHDRPATIVPIPNSHVVAADTENFKTLDLARKVAAESNGRFMVLPALVFKEVQKKSREGGPRDPKHFEAAYDVLRELAGPLAAGTRKT